MGRKVAVAWHALFSIVAGVLYFLFALPRQWEMDGDISQSLGTALRIVTGAIIALAALPVVFTLLRTRKPEYGTPQLALTLRTSSIVLHVLSGVLIIGTAISEIWLDLDSAGQWLFGIYGAAAAIAILGVSSFYLAFVAELPPPPPRPIKSKKPKKRRGRKGAEEPGEAVDQIAEEPVDAEDAANAEDAADTGAEDSAQEEAESDDDLAPAGGLRNRRPSGKTAGSRMRRRSSTSTE
jgi:hypothetical protein